jgi:hypothetical protein
MTPRDKQVLRLRRQSAQHAIVLFESCPGYPNAELQIYAERSKLDRNTRDPRKSNEERLNLLLQVFEIRAKAFAALVTDMQLQKAFIVLLESWVHETWFEYAGYPFDAVAGSSHKDVQRLLDKYREWRAAGYKRLVSANVNEPIVTGAQQPMEPIPTQSTSDDGKRRSKLLEEYKAAAGNPSNRQIYNARNSGIHKPEFYEWIAGRLPSTSETTKNFERFLREKKAPIPRNVSKKA